MHISLILTAISVFGSLAVAVITFLNLRELKITRQEEVRAYVTLYFEKFRTDYLQSIILKNFGKSSALVKNIQVEPNLEYSKGRMNDLKQKCLTDCKNIYLAPNQSIKSVFDLSPYLNQTIKVSLTYLTCGRTITENYDIDMSYHDLILTANPSIKNPLEGLSQINESIREVSDKLD
jgi:hypothetical protein